MVNKKFITYFIIIMSIAILDLVINTKCMAAESTEIKVLIPRHVVICNTENEAKRIANWLALGDFKGVTNRMYVGNGCYKDDNFYYCAVVLKTNKDKRLSYVKYGICNKPIQYGWVLSRHLVHKNDLFILNK